MMKPMYLFLLLLGIALNLQPARSSGTWDRLRTGSAQGLFMLPARIIPARTITTRITAFPRDSQISTSQIMPIGPITMDLTGITLTHGPIFMITEREFRPVPDWLALTATCPKLSTMPEPIRQ